MRLGPQDIVSPLKNPGRFLFLLCILFINHCMLYDAVCALGSGVVGILCVFYNFVCVYRSLFFRWFLKLNNVFTM